MTRLVELSEKQMSSLANVDKHCQMLIEVMKSGGLTCNLISLNNAIVKVQEAWQWYNFGVINNNPEEQEE